MLIEGSAFWRIGGEMTTRCRWGNALREKLADRDRQPDSNRIAPTPLVGLTFGRLHIASVGHRHHGKRASLVVCSCGTRKLVRLEHLRSGAIKSCGCLKAEVLHQPKGNQHATATEMATHEFW
jgi:hypothetical protein